MYLLISKHNFCCLLLLYKMFGFYLSDHGAWGEDIDNFDQFSYKIFLKLLFVFQEIRISSKTIINSNCLFWGFQRTRQGVFSMVLLTPGIEETWESSPLNQWLSRGWRGGCPSHLQVLSRVRWSRRYLRLVSSL